MVLAKLESTTGQLTRDIFSFVGGTSTGAVIAAAIAAGIPAPRIVELFANRTGAVFTGHPLLNTLKRIVFGSMYSTKKLLAPQQGYRHTFLILTLRASSELSAKTSFRQLIRLSWSLQVPA
jgi:patatin-like phospholipase/acyl hydrolase